MSTIADRSDRRPGAGVEENPAVAEIRDRRTPELDEVRRLLFPSLPPEDGWTRIERALERAKDERRLDAIDALARRVRPRPGAEP